MKHTYWLSGLAVPFCLTQQAIAEKQPHIIAGAAVGTRALNGKLDHPAGAVLKTLYGQDIVSFQLTG